MVLRLRSPRTRQKMEPMTSGSCSSSAIRMDISITSAAVLRRKRRKRRKLRNSGDRESKLMKFRLAIYAMGTFSFGLVSAFCQAPNYGPPATSYAIEAARYPNAASKPTPHTTDGHPDLTGVWHHYFNGLVAKVGDNSFTLNFGQTIPKST